MTVRLDIGIAGDQQFVRRMQLRHERVAHAYPLFSAVADFLLRVDRAQFDLDGAYGGKGWDPLKPATIARKARRGEDLRIMRATGMLERSLTKRGAPEQLLRIGDQEMTFGTHVPYAKYHQSLLPRTSDLPRRPLLQLTTLDRKHIERAIALWVSRGTILPGLATPGGGPTFEFSGWNEREIKEWQA